MSVSQRSYRGADRGGREQPARARTTGMDWAAAADAADREEVSQPAPPAAPAATGIPRIELSVEESLRFAQLSAFLDGWLAGAQAVATQVRERALREILEA